ncbi:MAG TPA: amino acid ABC transporter permease [Candidatus Acetothermia bacterium]|nr:amino acid ABC transporter permease [Candidatus Acetothermia bacterium]
MEALFRELPWFLRGVGVAVEVLSGVMGLGLFLGLGAAMLQVYGPPPVPFLVTIVERILRGIPPIVLLLLIFYLPWNLPPLLVAILGLGLCSAAYQSQIFRTAFLSVAVEEIEAARALGMSGPQSLFHVVLPQAVRRALGPWSNELASEIKDTSLAYIVGVVEILRQARYVISYTYGNSLLVFGFCALIYFLLTRLGNSLLFRLERRLWVPGFVDRQGRLPTRR